LELGSYVKDRRQFTYDPNSNTITISFLEESPVDISSPAMLLTTMHEVHSREGAQVTVEMGDYRGRRVQVQNIVASNAQRGADSWTLTLYIDTTSKLLYGAEVKGIDSAGNSVMGGAMTVDYPETGPQEIYDLGVPRDAHIVDTTPSIDFKTLREGYNRRKAEPASGYIAVIVHREKSSSDLVRMLDVDYRSGRKERHERYFLSPRGELIDELEGLRVGDVGPLLAWARHRCDDPHASISIHLHDGQYSSSISRDGEDGWGKVNRAYSPGGDSGLSQTVAFSGWPAIPSTARIIADDYAQQNGWICIENLTQGMVFPNGAVGHPGRFLYYLDPGQDYLCRRQVMEWRPDAEWQRDKSWLKHADPQKIRAGSMTVQEITEVFQAPNGHWYPKVIVQNQTEAREDYRNAPMQVYDVQTIYLDTSPTFPEGIFDIDKLPGR